VGGGAEAGSITDDKGNDFFAALAH